MSRGRGHRCAAAAAAVFVIALGLRLLYLHQVASGPLWDRPILDEAYNHEWAARVAAGAPGPSPPYFRAPLYPWFLAGIYRLGGPAPGHARIAQALLSALTCLGIAALAGRLHGAVAAASAGLLAATYWPWVYFDGELQDVPLTLALDVASLLLLVHAAGPPRRPGEGGPARGAALALTLAGGIGFGLSAIARPTILIAMPAVAWWLLRSRRPGDGSRWWLPLAFAAGLSLPILPIAAQNLLVGGDRVLIASQGGLNFYLGNNPDADGRSARLPGASGEWEAMVAEGNRRAEAAAGRPLRPSEVSRHWFGEGFRYWIESPGAALGLTGRKLGMLLAAPELPNNKQIRFFTRRYAPMMRLPWPDFGVVAPLALVGLIWGRSGRAGRLLLAVIACYAAGVVAFFVAARFRMPLAVLLLVPAGGGVQALWRLVRAGPRRQLATALTVLVVAALGVNLPRVGFRENEAHAHYTLGNAYRDRGDLVAAVREYTAATELDPAFREARRNLGAALLRAGRNAEAVERLAPALRSDPEDAASRVNLGLALQAVGREEEALAAIEAAAGMDSSAETLVHLGNLRSRQGDPEGAAAAFTEALRRDPGSSSARFNLGNVRLLAGQPEAAAADYREILTREPDHAGAWINLGVALGQLDRPEEAVEALRRGLRAQPANLAARLALAGALRDAGRSPEARRELEAVYREAPAGSEVQRRAAEQLGALDGAPLNR